eukprot:5884468-Pleurochrysis_carterae.AAC.9
MTVGAWTISAAAALDGDAILRACVSRLRSYVTDAVVRYVCSLSHFCSAASTAVRLLSLPRALICILWACELYGISVYGPALNPARWRVAP